MFFRIYDNRVKQRRAWLLFGWVTAERSCLASPPSRPLVGCIEVGSRRTGEEMDTASGSEDEQNGLLSLSRSVFFRVVGLNTGHGYPRKHLHRVGILRKDPARQSWRKLLNTCSLTVLQ
ncbi:hypothetical protein J6590_060249 [Homalodisca vitripennis]|nr:hypothetical protein J6590_060249 [Homalodisca vitripennis]